MTIRSTAITLLAALALLAAGCGKDEEGKPIPRAQAAELERQLASIQDRFDFGDGACTDITDDNQPAVARILSQIPQDVDPDVRSAVEESFDRLFELSSTQCDETGGQDTTPTEPETTPTEPETTPTEPETTPTEPERTDTGQTTEPDLPPDKQKKDKGGNGNNGNGNGGGGAPAPEGN